MLLIIKNLQDSPLPETAAWHVGNSTLRPSPVFPAISPQTALHTEGYKLLSQTHIIISNLHRGSPVVFLIIFSIIYSFNE